MMHNGGIFSSFHPQSLQGIFFVAIHFRIPSCEKRSILGPNLRLKEVSLRCDKANLARQRASGRPSQPSVNDRFCEGPGG